MEKDNFKNIMSNLATNISPLDSVQTLLMETIFTNLDQYQQVLKNTSALKLIRTFITSKMDLDKAEKENSIYIATKAISASAKPVYKSDVLNNIVNIFCNAFMGYVFAVWQNGSELESSNAGIIVDKMLDEACEKIVKEVSNFIYRTKIETTAIGYRSDSISTATTEHNVCNGGDGLISGMSGAAGMSGESSDRSIGSFIPIKANLEEKNNG